MSDFFQRKAKETYQVLSTPSSMEMATALGKAAQENLDQAFVLRRPGYGQEAVLRGRPTGMGLLSRSRLRLPQPSPWLLVAFHHTPAPYQLRVDVPDGFGMDCF